MHELLEKVLVAHGGLECWNALTTVRATVSLHAPDWPGEPRFRQFGLEASTKLQVICFDRYGLGNHVTSYMPERVELFSESGEPLVSHSNPRGFPGAASGPPADTSLESISHLSVAVWTYINAPFLFALPGFQVAEIAPVQQKQEQWRRLVVRSSVDAVAEGCAAVAYVGPDHMVRRYDYMAPFPETRLVTSYPGEYREFNGIRVATSRHIVPGPGVDNGVQRPFVMVLEDVRFS